MAFNVGISRKMFNRMFKGKSKIPYKLSVRGEQYQIYVRLSWRWAFFKGFTKKFGAKIGKAIEPPEKFKAGEKAHGFILENLKPTFDSIVERERKKLRNLALLSAKVQDAEFRRSGDNILLFVVVTGLCKYDI